MAFTNINHLKETQGENQMFLQFNDKIIVVDYKKHCGWFVKVYELIDSTDEFDLEECRLSLITDFYNFKDSGHAVNWAINRIR